MSHDLYASWATQEVSRMLKASPDTLFAIGPQPNLDVYANRESGRLWPIPDGRITAEQNTNVFEVAVELKRVNEGLHGVLTAIGQAQAYIYKGYSGAAIIIPDSYTSFATPGIYIRDVLDRIRPDLPIGVFSYGTPNLTIATPFLNKITIHKNINLTAVQRITPGNFLTTEKSKTQWAHLREGSSDADAFFRYLQIAKQLDLANPTEPTLDLPAGLVAAIGRVAGAPSILKHLSNSPGDNFHDIVWRNFWFKYILTSEVSKIWITPRHGAYELNDSRSLIKMDSTNFKTFFAGRRDSIKNRLISALNLANISEPQAWDAFVANIHDRAHSYREDIDSGLSHLGLLTPDGKPSELGYQFVDAVERTGDSYSGKPRLIFGAAILKNGNLAAFLHYIYKVSEEAFKANPMRFIHNVVRGGQSRRAFNKDAYLDFVRDSLANRLNVMNTAVARGGTPRKAFQGELAILRKFDFVQSFRIGVGLEINWPAIQDFLDYNID